MQKEGNTIQNTTACEEMEYCHFFNSKILTEVVPSLADINSYAENEEDVEADISKCISFCTITVKTAIRIAEGIFDHYVNDCIFQEILERKIAVVEKNSGAIFNENTVIALICWYNKIPNSFNQS